MSLWPHLNQMDKIKQIFLKHPDLFESCGIAIVGCGFPAGTCTPRVMLARDIPQEKRRAFAAKFQFIPWRRVRNYNGNFDYLGEYEQVEFKIDDVEIVPTLPFVDAVVVFEDLQEQQTTQKVYEHKPTDMPTDIDQAAQSCQH